MLLEEDQGLSEGSHYTLNFNVTRGSTTKILTEEDQKGGLDAAIRDHNTS